MTRRAWTVASVALNNSLGKTSVNPESIETAERIRHAVMKLEFDVHQQDPLRVTVSIGAFLVTPEFHDMKKAVSLMPEFPYSYYNLGNLYTLSSDLPEAILQYTKAIQLYPYLPEAYYNRGLVLIYLKDSEKGCLDMSKAGELGVEEAYSVISKYCIKKQ